jgi:hypothetical protein
VVSWYARRNKRRINVPDEKGAIRPLLPVRFFLPVKLKLKNRIKNMDTLESDIRRIVKKINNTRGICPSIKIGKIRKILKSAMKCPINRRTETLLFALRKTSEALNESRKEFHSKHLKIIREEISQILHNNNN